MRHAEAAAEEPGESDFDRCLTTDGVRMAQVTAAAMKHRGFRFDRIISSSATRTLQTAEIIADEMQLGVDRLNLDELYLAPAKAFEAAICERAFDDESTVLIVGHNPGIAGLICRWADRALAVPPATVAVFNSTADTWHDVRLTKIHVPKLVCLIQDGRVA
jgi:phosphohistidine phosphatase